MVPKPELSVSLAGLDGASGVPWAGGPRTAIEWASAAGFRAVQLDGSAPGIRARELSRSARRDIAALLRRRELAFSGLDLWIPPEHFVDGQRVMRAVDATREAMGMASELDGVVAAGSQRGAAVVSIMLPASIPEAVLAELEAAAAASGCLLADHALDRIINGRNSATEQAIRIGIDPAMLLLAGHDPTVTTARLVGRIASARLSNASKVGRIAPGSRSSEGRLDQPAYLAALSIAGYVRPLVLDLRGVADQDRAARQVLSSW
jgi:sugar phosphate isomerase/epimerase